MKKLTHLLAACLLTSAAAYAKPVTISTAQKVAENCYRQNSAIAINNSTLAFTETSASGQAVYYVFNINEKDGWVIISADDAALPVIGYSTHGHYSTTNQAPEFTYWMTKYKKQIVNIQQKNIQATQEIKKQWSNYANNVSNKKVTGATVSPLIRSTWDQAPNYNAMCPGTGKNQAVTGCVATAMAQIMRYWSYPAIGMGSSCYVDSTTYGYSMNYGQLCAEYDTSHYDWANMPLSISGPNYQIARLMYDCGVSVDMDYDPSGSGAWVITQDDSICAQTSYVKYFGYDDSTIAGYNRTQFADSVWIPMIENELLHNRPVQYAGFGSAGGHTWVCDGFDASNNFDMNWGWSGADDGYFNLNNLNPGGDLFDSGEQAVIGIQPPYIRASFNANPLTGCSGMTVNFTDRSMSPTTITAWNWSFPGGYPSTSTAQNPSVTYSAPGTYNVTEVVTSSVGTDTLTQTAYIDVETPVAPPIMQDFESGVFPPAGWTVNNPNNHASVWQLNSTVGGFGKSSNCMYYNNCSGGVTGQYDQMYSSLADFTTITNPYLYFDVAYTPYDNTYSDTLAVYYSTDCGTTWHNIYLKGGMTLCTTGGKTITGGANTNTQGCFVPLAANWRTDTVPLTFLAGQSSVMFSFENRSGNGSNMYVDNIMLPKVPLGIATYSAPAPSLTMFPNPGSGLFTCQLGTKIAEPATISVYNVLGEKIYANQLDISHTSFSINLTDKPAGVYFYRVVTSSGKVMGEGKLIIK